MKYEVVIYGTDILRQKAEPIETIDDDVRQLAADMLETMHASNGIGLAAQQIGKAIAICVIELPRDAETDKQESENADIAMPLIMINPTITESSGKEICEEGCLSFPEIVAPLTRATSITAVFQDLAGNSQTIKATGLLARAIQHEIDHLNGILIVDRMSPVKKITLSGRLKKLKKAAADGS